MPFNDRGTPHFLTDVFFDPKVLKKYYDEPTRYSVEPGLIRCLDKWILRSFDRTDQGLIHVWLGDLHMLPASEQKHWRLHNVRPSGTITRSRFERDFEAKFVDPENDPIYYFRTAYERVNKAALAAYGADLFLALDPRDEYLLDTLHVPVTNEWPETDSQIAALAKICPDSINLRLLKDILPDEILQKLKDAGAGSIRHLEAYLVARGMGEDQARKVIRPFDGK
jgi:hypothetical protein